MSDPYPCRLNFAWHPGNEHPAPGPDEPRLGAFVIIFTKRERVREAGKDSYVKMRCSYEEIVSFRRRCGQKDKRIF